LLRSTHDALVENIAQVKKRRNVHLARGVAWTLVAAILFLTPLARWTYQVLPSLFVLPALVELGYTLFFKHSEVSWLEYTIARIHNDLLMTLSDSEQDQMATNMRERRKRKRHRGRSRH
jgi:hypothetical protein